MACTPNIDQLQLTFRQSCK